MMLTAFAEQTDLSLPRPEYPRPRLVREQWLNLNGEWEFAGAPKESAPHRFATGIRVPFPPESELSGIGKPGAKGYCLWYRRAFTLPESFAGGRVLLHFGACDQSTSVWCNGEEIGRHRGGYAPFSFELTECLTEGENVLLVRVEDELEKSGCAFGGQLRSVSWSGIWQTVWLECVPELYITDLQLVPRVAESSVDIRVETNSDAPEECLVSLEGEEYALTSGETYTLPVSGALWTPDDPALIELTVRCGEDRVESYFALREFSLGRDEKGTPCFLLNGEPIFVTGVLTQGLWPDGLPTAPSDEAIEYDIAAAKSFGFNTLRLVDKVECERFYYHCDRLGMMVWQSIPTGGRDKKPLLPVSDSHYAFYGRRSTESRREHIHELGEIVTALRNAPSIVLWELFDEDRGRFDAENALRCLKALDDSRIADISSGCETEGAKLRTLHALGKKPRFTPDRAGRVTAFSLVGGNGFVTDGHVLPGRCRAKRMFNSPQGLLFAVEELMEDLILPARREGLAGFIYSQLTDVGTDVTGLLPYDRRVEKLSPRQLRKVLLPRC